MFFGQVFAQKFPLPPFLKTGNIYIQATLTKTLTCLAKSKKLNKTILSLANIKRCHKITHKAANAETLQMQNSALVKENETGSNW